VKERNEPVADELRRRLKVLLWATCILYGVVIVIGGAGIWINHQQSSETHNALCTLYDDLKTRVNGTKDYLLRHPNGFPGISSATLVKSIHDQEQTLDALSTLNCD